MAGLLNYNPDPVGMGLLSAGAALMTPRAMGGGLGPGLLAFNQGAMQAQMMRRQQAQDAIREQLLMSQIEENKATAKQRDALVTKELEKQRRDEELRAFLMGRLGGGAAPQSALAQGAQAGSVGPTVENQQRMMAGGQQGFPFSLNDVTTLKALGGPDLMDAFKFANTPQSFAPGSTVRDAVSGAERVLPKLADGMRLVNGTVAPMPGFVDTQSQIIDAQEAAKARYGSPVSVPTADGRMQMMTPLDFARRGQPSAGTGGTGAPASPVASRSFPSAEPAGSRDTRTGILQEEIRKAISAGDPDTVASVERELDRLQGRTGAVGQSSAVKQAEAIRDARSKASAGLDVKSAEGAREQASGARSVAMLAAEIEKLIGDPQAPQVYGNSIPDRLAMGLNAVGGNETPKAVNTNQVRRLGNQLVLARGSLGAGVSVADAERYDKAAGDFTRAQTVSDMLASVKTMREVAEKYSDLEVTARQRLEGGPKILRYNPRTDRLE